MQAVIAGGFNDDFPMMMEIEVDLNTGMERPKCPPVAVAFGYHPRKDDGASVKAGHDVYKDVEYVKIALPGDKTTLYFQPALDEHRRRFPKACQAFKNRALKPVEGMPIDQWPVVSRSLALTMKACHIHTVEALAAVHDGHVDKLGFNAREMREKAKAWLAQAKEGAASQALVAEKQALENRLKGMEAQMASLISRLSPQERARLEAEAKAVPVNDAPATGDDVEQDVAAAARRPRARAA